MVRNASCIKFSKMSCYRLLKTTESQWTQFRILQGLYGGEVLQLLRVQGHWTQTAERMWSSPLRKTTPTVTCQTSIHPKWSLSNQRTRLWEWIRIERIMLPSSPTLSANWITFAKTVSRTNFHLNREKAIEAEIAAFQSEGKKTTRSQLTSSERWTETSAPGKPR